MKIILTFTAKKKKRALVKNGRGNGGDAVKTVLTGTQSV